MAYTDDYVKTNWVNYPSTNTPLNQTNLNHAEGGIKTNCGRIANLDTTKANQSDLLLTMKNVTFDSTTGTFTFTLWNNTTITVNTDIEKVAVNFTYDDDPASPHYQNLVLELSDGTYKYIDMSALITQYEFTNTSTIAFTVGVGGEITANVIDGSITANKLQPNYLADCQAAQTGAQNAKAAADADALKAEGYANGTQNGVPVSSGSPYHENNAKWWKEQAQAIASQSLAGLTDVDINAPADGDILVYDSGDNEWKNQGNHAVTVTNNPISITTQSAQVARDAKITLNPIQAAGTPTPSSPIPIFGYDSVDLTVCGKNQFNKDDANTILNAYIGSGILVSYSNTKSVFVRCKPNTVYTVSKTAGQRFSVGYTKNIPSINSQVFSVSTDYTSSSITITTGADAKYIVAWVYNGDYDTITAEQMLASVQIEEGSATAYEAYTSPINFSQPLPSTIYSGEHDVETGVLKVTHGIVDLGSLTWYTASTSNGHKRMVAENIATVVKKPSSNSEVANIICSCYVAVSGLDSYEETMGVSVASSGNVSIYDSDYNTSESVAAFTTAVTGQKLVYELATPYEIQLTPYDVQLLQGANVITSNGTSVTLTYREGTIATLADIPSETVNKLADMVADVQGDISTLDSTKTDLSAIAPIEDGATASQAYKVNEYFIRGGKLCKCISAISSGATFTLNTNYVETTIAKEIPKITVGNTDLTDGISPLPAGQFYIYIS